MPVRDTSMFRPIEQAERSRRTAAAREVTLIVHGTFAHPGYDRPGAPGADVPWWKSYGSFGEALDAALERHGSRARCGSDPEELLRAPNLFGAAATWDGWSGANSEVERRKGAYNLAATLRALQRDPTVGTFHIVAHSHGGNVARRALRYLKSPNPKWGKLICLGTPFLRFADREFWRRWAARLQWPMLVVLAALVAGFTALAHRPHPDQLKLGFSRRTDVDSGRGSRWAFLETPLMGTPFDLDTVRGISALAVATLYFALYPVDKILGLPAWLAEVATRFAILVGARAAAGGAAPPRWPLDASVEADEQPAAP
jgi:hypothetical protein